MKDKLIEIGLTNQEAGAYLYLLEKEKITATKIAKDLKINRSVIYSVIEKLIEKGLANFILIDGKRHFSATNPKVLEDYLKDKQKILNEILPNLESIKKKQDELFSCEVYEGIKGGIAVLKDIIREGKDYVSFGDEGQFSSASETILEQYTRQLDEKKIKERILTKEGINLKYSRKNSEIRYLSKEFSFPTITTIYGDKVAIAIFEKPYHVVLIKSKSLAKTYKGMFEGLWKISKK
jgi:HTH-type transcriptional regulator, sugar sensing transcriptional regulator